ncbi:uncharacterized protein Tco025E_05489 [Trypanosoma conorhini]|uniref:Uncharacterized protein n=1 Tax=Trypanosoma conorhini TaxID=83891 RepID=A0A422PCX6_9TRYP|nr:uncharacterized protein Tco025E_05489 [Trypanosoma conorhini]RNF15569.1 hypothetical protein Tco025E_05489 [Trypanosoma conorhini]
MSRGDFQLQPGAGLSPCEGKGLPTRAPKNYSFAELIRAREEQQRRIRDALEEQNRQLRARLASEEGNEGGAAAASSAAAVRRRGPSRSPSKPQTVPVEEFITFVTEMKHLINCAQEADLVALHALQDRVDFQSRDLIQRLTELEAQMIAMQRREEFGYTSGGSPFVPMTRSKARTAEDNPALEYVLRELENVRRTAEEATQRTRQLDEALEGQQLSLREFERELNALETKMVDIESLPYLFRREAMTLEERYAEFTHRVHEEIAQQQEHPSRSCENDNVPMRLLEEQLRAVERAVVELSQRGIATPKDHMNGDIDGLVSGLVERKVQEVKEAIASSLWAKLQELHQAAPDKDGDDPTSSIEGDAPLGSNRQRATTTNLVEDLAERVRRLETTLHTATKRSSTEQPSVEEERLKLPTNQLACAAVLPESAMARGASSSTDAAILDTKEIVERVASVETQMNSLEYRLNYLTTKLEECNTGHKTPPGECEPTTDGGVRCSPVLEGNDVHLDISTKGRHTQEGVTRHLQEELELAAVGLRSKAAPEPCVTQNIAAAAIPNERHFVDKNISMLSTPGQAAQWSCRRKKPVAREEPRTLSFGPFKAPQLVITSESLSKTVTAMHERKKQKEDAVKKIIDALRDVQRRFSQLSERESAAPISGTQRSRRERPACNTYDDTVCVLNSIASQKEAILSKEKQLLNLRNTLWREIAQLEEDERDLLAS